MKATDIPKGVRFSFLMMSTPLLLTTGYLAMMAPMVSAGTGVVDPAQFAYLARTCMRILALNISFMVLIKLKLSILGWHPLWFSLSNLWDSSNRWRIALGLVPNDLFFCASSHVLLTNLLPAFLHSLTSTHRHFCVHRPHDYSADDTLSRSSLCWERTCTQVVLEIPLSMLRWLHVDNLSIVLYILLEVGVCAEKGR